MRVKDAGVSLSQLHPCIQQLFPTLEEVFAWGWNKEVVVTSGCELTTKHMPGSLHYDGLAIDLRSKHCGDYPARRSIFQTLKKTINDRFPGWYDVLWEGQQRESEHFHIEASPILLGLIEGETKEVAS